MADCPNCHTSNAEDAKFCVKCGAKMPEVSAAPVLTAQPIMPAEPVKKGNPQHNGKAIAGLVLGIVSFVFCWFGFISIPASIVGIVMSALGLKSQKSGLAVGGLISAILGLILTIIIIVAIGLWIFSYDWSSFTY